MPQRKRRYLCVGRRIREGRRPLLAYIFLSIYLSLAHVSFSVCVSLSLLPFVHRSRAKLNSHFQVSIIDSVRTGNICRIFRPRLCVIPFQFHSLVCISPPSPLPPLFLSVSLFLEDPRDAENGSKAILDIRLIYSLSAGGRIPSYYSWYSTPREERNYMWTGKHFFFCVCVCVYYAWVCDGLGDRDVHGTH